MTRKTLQTLRDTAPFKPFSIYLADGQRLKVVTPDHLFFFPNGEEFLVVLPDGGFRFVSYDQVVSVGREAVRSKERK